MLAKTYIIQSQKVESCPSVITFSESDSITCSKSLYAPNEHLYQEPSVPAKSIREFTGFLELLKFHNVYVWNMNCNYAESLTRKSNSIMCMNYWIVTTLKVLQENILNRLIPYKKRKKKKNGCKDYRRIMTTLKDCECMGIGWIMELINWPTIEIML